MVGTFNPRAIRLGYVALGVKDLSRSRDYYCEVLGLAHVLDQDPDVYLSVGAEHHNIVLRQSDEKALVHLGYELSDGADLDEFERDLRAFGLSPERKSDSQPGIDQLVEVLAPGGNLFHFYKEMCVGPGYRRSGVAPARLGHIAVITPEAKKLLAFYQRFLGFHYTDDIGGIATFMTCNSDHHVVNIVDLPESRVHHIAFELSDNSDHARACDTLTSVGMPTLWGPARHYAGHNLAAYHYDPDRVMIELYTQMDVYLPALGRFEARPWHRQNPLRPQSWKKEQMTAWETDFNFDLVTA
ncbi:glyoxalase/bleomycin resistance/extradiol dioxygenase family protein [Mesorhizobium sp. M7A.F.Ca.US.006.01.1.1]|uniref:VOC family protein n=1 Tax=Mesorhizobium sp. M7A.F.Ca.US.006.01.1.1 TaxID=2496707 RepID=UPI000FCBEF19|nr:VOC family protein [Mesorhizobium sp. M7A.F.Ca.US.006.01.1.1]RUZ74231.1 glyoxalase/bleomycin resistance/extradiol dioxygenase family protein [Mesorhizobium sp. M7A.F.Ca.US.006.01.1.1]